MTEKEKMLRGMLYAPAHDETLLAELAACKAQCQQFNQRAYQAEGIESAQMLLRRLLGAAGEGLRIEPPFWCDYGWNISVGRNFYMRRHSGRRRRDLWRQRAGRPPVWILHLRPPLGRGKAGPGAGVRLSHPCGQRRLDRRRRPRDARRLHRRRGGHRLRQRGDEGHPCRSPGCGRPLPPHPPHHGGGPDAALIRRSSCPSGKFRPGVGNLCRMCYHGGAAGDASAAVQSNAPPARCLCEQEEAP